MHIGHVDLAQYDRVAGWAADPETPDAVLEVVVEVDGREHARVRADRFRADLQRLGHLGEGRHGFEHQFRPRLDPAVEHEVVVRFAGSQAVVAPGPLRVERLAVAPAGAAGRGVYFSDRSGQPDPRTQQRPRAPVARAPDKPPIARGPAQVPSAPRQPGLWAGAGWQVSARSRTARPRYVLHVGLPKTGTEYLQHNFWRLRERLRECGVYYPSEWWEPGPIFSHHQLASDLTQIPNERVAGIVSQLDASGAGTVLLSSEGFNLLPEEGLLYLRGLMQGADVEIVFYARRWSEWIPSQWQQAIRQGALQTFPEWYSYMVSNAATHGGINQALLLDKFAKVFGRDNVRLISYSNLVDRGVDLFDHFCREILHLPASPELKGDGETVREPMGVLVTELIRCLNAAEAMRGAQPGDQVFGAYQRIAADPAVAGDVGAARAAMSRHVVEVMLDDNAFFLQSAYDALGRYGDRLVSPEYGGSVFERRGSTCRYVRGEYLLEPGAAAALTRISAALRPFLAAA